MKPFTIIAVVVLSVIALVQLARFLLGWVITVGGVVIPVWISAIVSFGVGVLAVMLWLESRR